MTFHIITLFPHTFDSYLGESILKRAIENKKIKVKFYNPRDFAENRWKRIDRAPYGGGPGMVIQAEPVIKAVEAALKEARAEKRETRKKLRIKDKGLRIIWLSPSGTQFTNETGAKLAKHQNIIIICGRYEGIDARVKKAINATRNHESAGARQRIGGSAYSMAEMPRIKLEEISVGPFVLTGGELPAMIMIDVISRQVEGVLGDPKSREETRVASPNVYARPEVFSYKGKKFRVPKILLTGHHAKIDEWRQSQKKK